MRLAPVFCASHFHPVQGFRLFKAEHGALFTEPSDCTSPTLLLLYLKITVVSQRVKCKSTFLSELIFFFFPRGSAIYMKNNSFLHGKNKISNFNEKSISPTAALLGNTSTA